MVTILVCLVVLGGAAAAILVARSALRQPATDLPVVRGRRRRALRAGADRATAFLIPSGPPTTAHVRYRSEPVPSPAAPAPAAAEPAPAVVDLTATEDATAPVPSADPRPAPSPEVVRPRYDPIADLTDDRDEVRSSRVLEPALLGFPSAPPSAGAARSMVLAPARLLTARLLAARSADPVVVAPSAAEAHGHATVVEPTEPDVAGPPVPPEEDDEVPSAPPARRAATGPVPHPIRRVLRRLRGTTLLVALLVGLGLVLAVVLVAALAVVALGVRAAVAG